MKKILAKVLCAVMAAALCLGIVDVKPMVTTTASAESVSDGKGVEAGSVSCKAGETVQVPLSLFGVYSQGIVLELSCDSPLEIEKVSNAMATDGDGSRNFIRAVYVTGSIFDKNEPFSYVTVDVPADTEPGIYPITISIESIADEAGEDVVNPICINGSVTVVESTDEPIYEDKGVEVGNVSCEAGETVDVPLSLFGVNSQAIELELSCDTPLTFRRVSGAMAYDEVGTNKMWALFVYGSAITDEQFSYATIDVPKNTEPGTYPIIISINQLDDNGEDVVNPVCINGSVTVVESVDEPQGIEVGNVSCLAGETVDIPLNLFGVYSWGIDLELSCDSPLEIQKVSRAATYTVNGTSNIHAVWTADISDDECFDSLFSYATIEVPLYAEPGTYPITISINRLDDNGEDVVNPVCINGSVTVVESATDDYETYGDLTYQKVDEDDDGTYDYISITSCDESAVSVDIPAEIDGLPVKRICDAAFSGCSNIESITLPDSVTIIDDAAFFGCSNLANIAIPNGVTSIGEAAFEGCFSLKSVTIPDIITSINGYAFCGCSNLESITIPDNVTRIGNNAFSNCSNLENITIPDSVTNIGYYAFSDCDKLISITIPDSVTSIDSFAFYGTPWLATKQAENPLVIVNSILIDGTTCSGAVEIPESVTSIAQNAFSGCSNLEDVIIPNSVKSIGDAAFSGCSNLVCVTIPESITSIGKMTFWSCDKLESVTILNPNCEICDSEYTISNGYNEDNKPYYNGIIYGYGYSTIEAYAEKYGYTFQPIPEDIESAAGVVFLKKYLVGLTDYITEEYDINSDGSIDVFDMAILRKRLLNGK